MKFRCRYNNSIRTQFHCPILSLHTINFIEWQFIIRQKCNFVLNSNIIIINFIDQSYVNNYNL